MHTPGVGMPDQWVLGVLDSATLVTDHMGTDSMAALDALY